MMHHCCSQGHVMGTCTCGMFHDQANSYSMPYSMPSHVPYGDDYDEPYMYSFTPCSSASSSSSVDCTLSLGTPSTRFSEDEEKRNRHHERRSSVSKQNAHYQTKPSRGSNGNSNGDPLFARRCANCDTTSTPLWRNGPRGPKSLCNACGIRFKKEERRASAAAAAATTAAASGGAMESAAHMYAHQNNNSWYYTNSQSQTMGNNELRFVDDTNDMDTENNGVPYLSWRLNVADRTGLVHDFTR